MHEYISYDDLRYLKELIHNLFMTLITEKRMDDGKKNKYIPLGNFESLREGLKGILEEIGVKQDKEISSILRDYTASSSITYPFGGLPDSEFNDFLEELTKDLYYPKKETISKPLIINQLLIEWLNVKFPKLEILALTPIPQFTYMELEEFADWVKQENIKRLSNFIEGGLKIDIED